MEVSIEHGGAALDDSAQRLRGDTVVDAVEDFDGGLAEQPGAVGVVAGHHAHGDAEIAEAAEEVYTSAGAQLVGLRGGRRRRRRRGLRGQCAPHAQRQGQQQRAAPHARREWNLQTRKKFHSVLPV